VLGLLRCFLPAWLRFSLPEAVTRKRFFEALWVFIFGMAAPSGSREKRTGPLAAARGPAKVVSVRRLSELVYCRGNAPVWVGANADQAGRRPCAMLSRPYPVAGRASRRLRGPRKHATPGGALARSPAAAAGRLRGQHRRHPLALHAGRLLDLA